MFVLTFVVSTPTLSHRCAAWKGYIYGTKTIRRLLNRAHANGVAGTRPSINVISGRPGR